MTTPQGSSPGAGPEDMTGRAPTPPSVDPADQLARLGRSWTWLMGAAMATLVPGILALVWPDVTLHVLAVLIGLYLLVTGVFRFVAVFGRDSGDRVPGLIVALLCVLGGVLCLRNPLQTIAALSLIVGAVWLVSGIVTLYSAIATKNMPHRGIVMAVAALGIVAGIVVLALPAESARTLTRLLGLWLVLMGLAEAAVALAWRSALRRAGITAHDTSGPATGRTGAAH
ncbi:HdeD family acid-resistance protein [Streptomyces sp. NPDC058579]|uniref:HdeD family acid-resistance protein n=1 Tax=Streptomyces sp. NPDC058579 TaxID=3346548 RepID=UPI00364DD295